MGNYQPHFRDEETEVQREPKGPIQGFKAGLWRPWTQTQANLVPEPFCSDEGE